MDLKKGDIIKLKPLDKINRRRNPGFNYDMDYLAGKMFTIEAITSGGIFRVKEDYGTWLYSTEWVDKILNKGEENEN